jgi:hypothetical protein
MVLLYILHNNSNLKLTVRCSLLCSLCRRSSRGGVFVLHRRQLLLLQRLFKDHLYPTLSTRDFLRQLFNTISIFSLRENFSLIRIFYTFHKYITQYS